MSPASLEIRPICPDDATLLADAFAFTSPQTYYRRFHGFKHEFTLHELVHLTSPDDDEHAALIAIDHCTRQPRLAAVVRFYRDRHRHHEAELAIIVHDPFQGHGLGARMLALAAERARDMGISEFRAVVQADNRPMRELFFHLFPDARVDCRDGSDVHYVAPIDVTANEYALPLAA